MHAYIMKKGFYLVYFIIRCNRSVQNKMQLNEHKIHVVISNRTTGSEPRTLVKREVLKTLLLPLVFQRPSAENENNFSCIYTYVIVQNIGVITSGVPIIYKIN